MRRQISSPSIQTFLLLASLGLCMTWALSSASLNLAEFCGNKPILICSSSNYGDVHSWLTALFIAGVFGVFFVLRGAPSAGSYTLFYALIVGVINRYLRDSMLFVSDVIDATREALRVLISGHNPYFHTFLTTRPAHSPFPYLPGEMFLYGIPYALFGTIDTVDRAIGVLTLILLAALAPIVGVGRAALCTALFATFMLAAATSVDGTNDGGLALLLVACAVLLAWSEAAHVAPATREVCFHASAVFLAWALLFKAFSWPFLPFIGAYLLGKDRRRGKRYLFTTVSVSVLAVLPFLFPSPRGFMTNVYQGFVFHEYLYGLNLWTALYHAGISVDAFARFITPAEVLGAIGVFVAGMWRGVHSLGEALLSALAVIVTALLFAHFSTSSYYTFTVSVFIAAIALVEIPEDAFAGADAGWVFRPRR